MAEFDPYGAAGNYVSSELSKLVESAQGPGVVQREGGEARAGVRRPFGRGLSKSNVASVIKLKGSRPRRWHIKKTAAALDSAAKNARK